MHGSAMFLEARQVVVCPSRQSEVLRATFMSISHKSAFGHTIVSVFEPSGDARACELPNSGRP